ncbi:MAG: hypothetical protein BWY82_02365 [Verrucomicrobia bacterium ADurb.Bin474]|nr:MAG: hypothetical protein BWY82_02365 [Verrucomicrobia bacterium ADurb.Bin474]
MWPEGLIASYASDVEESSINNVRPLGSLEIVAGRMLPLLLGRIRSEWPPDGLGMHLCNPRVWKTLIERMSIY